MRAFRTRARAAACFAAFSDSFEPSVGTRMCLVIGLHHDGLQARDVVDDDVLLPHRDEAFFLEAGEETAHRLQREPEVAADLLARHAQVEFALRETARDEA